MSKLIETMVPDALACVDAVCRGSLESGRHKPGDWKDQGIEGNLEHALAHFENTSGITGLNLDRDPTEDHLTNLCCRVLMALQLRIEQNTRK